MRKILLSTTLVLSLSGLFTNCAAPTPEEQRQEELKENMKDLAKSAGKLINSLGDNTDANIEDLGAQAEDLIDKFGGEFEGNISEAIDGISKQLDGIAKDENGNPVMEPASNFRTLKEGLPGSIAGFERQSAKGSTKGMMGMKISMVEAVYKNSDDKSVNLTLIDGGSFTQMIGGAQLNIDIDEESDNGFQRSTEFNGDKAFESCEGKHCQFIVLLNKKYLVTLKGRNASIDDLHQIVASIKL